MRDEHLWTEGPCDDGKIHWGFHGLQEGNSFRSDYKCKIASQHDNGSFIFRWLMASSSLCADSTTIDTTAVFATNSVGPQIVSYQVFLS